jgi:preprotein translocase subunit SecF
VSAQPPPPGAPTSITILRELWRRKFLVVGALLVSAAISVLFIRSQPPKVEAEGSIQVLVDSAKSPIADANRDLGGLTARAGVFARLMTGGRVINRVAEETGIAAKQIDVAGPSPLAGEAPGITEAPAYVNPYRIEISQQPELPILTVVTHAPTTEEARALAAAAPRAMSREVAAIQTQQETKASKRIEFRTLGPAQAAVVDDSLGKKVAIGVFVVLLALFLTLIVVLPRFRAAWRSAGAEAAVAAAEEPSPAPKVEAPKPQRETAARKPAGGKRTARKAAKKKAEAATPVVEPPSAVPKTASERPPLTVVGARGENLAADASGEARETGEAGGE